MLIAWAVNFSLNVPELKRCENKLPKSQNNPWRGTGFDTGLPPPLDDPRPVSKLLTQCPAHGATPLHDAAALAREIGVAQLWVKDERTRMGLGSFKALGAAHAIARLAVGVDSADLQTALSDRVFVTASAGNHGLSVAAGARIFGARAVIYLAQTVPSGFAKRLQGYGADVVVEGTDYEASMAAAQAAAATNGWTLLSDSSWDGYAELPMRVMEGYLQIGAEVTQQIDQAPTHILLQAGVGGFAGAMAAHARRQWGDAPQIIVVEPEAAPALFDSITAGKSVTTTGPVSSMGRLDCKTPSLIALAGLSRDADAFVLISEAEAARAMPELKTHDLATSPSGGAGLVAVLAGLDLGDDARILAYVTEGPADD